MPINHVTAFLVLPTYGLEHGPTTSIITAQCKSPSPHISSRPVTVILYFKMTGVLTSTSVLYKWMVATQDLTSGELPSNQVTMAYLNNTAENTNTHGHGTQNKNIQAEVL